MGWIISIIIGGVAGWIASNLMNINNGLIANILLGIGGALVGSWLVRQLTGGTPGGIFGEVVVAVIGACILIYVYRLIKSSS
jgi:uncharacterized membrane protein YeaQ/YmgE (transglycosylase-associated protein family)